MSEEQLAVALGYTEHILERLPEIIDELRRRHDLTYQQIAAQAGLTLPTVHSCVKRKRGYTAGTAAALVSWAYAWTRPDPTHGRIDRDIQATVNAMHPKDVAQRTAIENTLQEPRTRSRVIRNIQRGDPVI